MARQFLKVTVYVHKGKFSKEPVPYFSREELLMWPTYDESQSLHAPTP